MLYANLCHTIRNSKDEYYKYYLNKNSDLVEELLGNSYSSNKTNILYNNILDYSIEIDNNNNLNIIHINSDGELYYSILSSEKTNRKLAQIDLNNFTIKFITLKLVKNSPHIFYVIRKNTSPNWYLYHNYYANGDWCSSEVTDIHCEKYIGRYMLDLINDDMYVFIQHNSIGDYIIKKFNPNLNSWELVDTIHIPDCFNATFITNKQGTAFIYYNCLVKHNILTYVKYKNYQKNNELWSEPFLLSNPQKNCIRPSITIKDDSIHLLWQDGNEISYAATDISGINIIKSSSLHKKLEKGIFKSIYLSSHPYDMNNKSNYSILSGAQKPVYLFDAKNEPEAKIKTEISTSGNPALLEDNTRNIGFTISPGLRHMQLMLIEKDKKLMEIASSYATFKNNINSIINDKAKSVLNNTLFVPDIGKTEDELLLGKLNFIINSLSKEIYLKEEKINELNDQLNKQLFKKLFHQ